MTEETKGHISCIIDELGTQCEKIAVLMNEAAQDYDSAVEVRDKGAKEKAIKEVGNYAYACAAISRTIAILREIKERRE